MSHVYKFWNYLIKIFVETIVTMAAINFGKNIIFTFSIANKIDK
jgi:hypothetical protein